MKPSAVKISARRPTTTAAAQATAEAEAASEVETRLVVEIPVSLRRSLKARAATQGMSIKDYLIGLLKKDGIA